MIDDVEEGLVTLVVVVRATVAELLLSVEDTNVLTPIVVHHYFNECQIVDTLKGLVTHHIPLTLSPKRNRSSGKSSSENLYQHAPTPGIFRSEIASIL